MDYLGAHTLFRFLQKHPKWYKKCLSIVWVRLRFVLFSTKALKGSSGAFKISSVFYKSAPVLIGCVQNFFWFLQKRSSIVWVRSRFVLFFTFDVLKRALGHEAVVTHASNAHGTEA